MKRKLLPWILTGICLPSIGQSCFAQGPYQPPQPQSYTSYYNKQLRNYHKPPMDIRNYTIDRYFYHQPNLSPYLNMGRRTGPNSLNNYYQYVRPEIQRRAQTNPAPRSPSVTPKKFNSNPYFNQIYSPIHR